jgi:DNA-binding NtrC family response regulator
MTTKIPDLPTMNLSHLEAIAVRQAIRYATNRYEVADFLGIPPRSLYRILRKMDLSKRYKCLKENL